MSDRALLAVLEVLPVIMGLQFRLVPG